MSLTVNGAAVPVDDLLSQGVSKNYALQCKALALLIILHHEAHEGHEGFKIRALMD